MDGSGPLLISIECDATATLPFPYTGQYFNGNASALDLHVYVVYENDISLINGMYAYD